MAAERASEGAHQTPPQELVFSRRFRMLLIALGFAFYIFSCSGIALLSPFWFFRVSALLLVAVGLLFIPGMISDFFTDFDTIGISRPTIFGRRFMRWSEIRHIRRIGGGIILRSARAQIVFRYSSFRNPEALVVEIERRVAPSALLSIEELSARRVGEQRTLAADSTGDNTSRSATTTARLPLEDSRTALRSVSTILSIVGLGGIGFAIWALPGSGTAFLPSIAIGGGLGLLITLVKPWYHVATFTRPAKQPLSPPEIAAREALISLYRPWPALAVGTLFALALVAYATIGQPQVSADMAPVIARATTADAAWYNVGLVISGVMALLVLHFVSSTVNYLAVLRASRSLVASAEEQAR